MNSQAFQQKRSNRIKFTLKEKRSKSFYTRSLTFETRPWPLPIFGIDFQGI